MPWTYRLPILLICIFAYVALAQDGPPAPPANGSRELPNLHKEKKFDGIDLSKYARFWESWHLITVRYRKDNVEQRFVYANDIAYKAMKAGKKVYPDGAMFGKVAFRAEADQAFPNSLEPERFTRIQLMKKDSVNHPEQNGWEYGIYLSDKGVDYPNEKSVVVACHACHQIVPGRDYVFSRPAFFVPRTPSEKEASFGSRFIEKSFDSLDKKLKDAFLSTHAELAPQTHVKVFELSMFEGSVDESLGPLIEYARRDLEPYLMADEKSKFFLAAVPATVPSAACENEVQLARVKSVHPKSQPKVSHHVIERGTACAEKINWQVTTER